MKKYLIILSALAALVACNKVEKEEQPAVDQMTFNFTVNSQDETKDKAGWEEGDVVYIFFKTIGTKYIKLERGAVTWNATAPGGSFSSSDFSGIADIDKVLTAVHFPKFVGDVTVAYDDVKNVFTFKKGTENIYTYYMSVATTYTATDSSVTATISMTKPAGYVQFFVPMPAAELTEGHTYQLLESHITPKALTSVALDGTLAFDTKTAGYALTGYAASNKVGENPTNNGMMFSGVLGSAGVSTSYTFSLVTNLSADKPYALGTQKLSGTKTISAGVIFNLPNITASWSALDPFVDMGAGSLLWATGNLSNSGIKAPEEIGLFYDWAGTTGYTKVEAHNFSNKIHWDTDHYTKYTGTDYTYVQPDDDAAYQVNNAWRLPTSGEANSMLNNSIKQAVFPPLYFQIGKLLTSTTTGIKLLIMDCGYRHNSVYSYPYGSDPKSGDNSNIWTSSYNTSSPGQVTGIYQGDKCYTTWNRSMFGFQVRPVKPVTP